MNIDNLIYRIAVLAIPVLFAITLHEAAHGWVASKLGDNTARMLGRLTLNPVKHIDPYGTILVPLVMFLLPGGLLFGWAKPVPVNTGNLKKPLRDMAIVAAAGPAANLLMAILWIIFLKLIYGHIGDKNIQGGLVDMASAGVNFNLFLMIFNLFPIPPLDGAKVLKGFLPPKYSTFLDQIEPYGFFIIIALIILGVIGVILSPLLDFSRTLLFELFIT